MAALGAAHVGRCASTATAPRKRQAAPQRHVRRAAAVAPGASQDTADPEQRVRPPAHSGAYDFELEVAAQAVRVASHLCQRVQARLLNNVAGYGEQGKGDGTYTSPCARTHARRTPRQKDCRRLPPPARPRRLRWPRRPRPPRAHLVCTEHTWQPRAAPRGRRAPVEGASPRRIRRDGPAGWLLAGGRPAGRRGQPSLAPAGRTLA